MSTPFRHPAAVVDAVIADLGYLTEFLLDEIDHGAIAADQLSPCALKALAALEGTRLLLPRLRVVRSNFVSDSRLPDTSAGAGLLDAGTDAAPADASEASCAAGNDRIIR